MAKDPSKPHSNEDRVVILPGRAYAVIDGVTDGLGTRYGGILSGQYAAMIVKGALEHLLSAPGELPRPFAIIEALTEGISRAHLARGMFEKAQSDRNVRLAAALALVLVNDTTCEVILVGDSGVRINGTEIIRMEKDLDLITATLRREAWPIIGRKVSDAVL